MRLAREFKYIDPGEMLRKIPRRLLLLWWTDYKHEPWDILDARLLAAWTEGDPLDYVPLLKDLDIEDDGMMLKLNLQTLAMAQEVD